LNTKGAVISGVLQAATGTFAGELQAATGTFAGELQAATGTFKGTLSVGSKFKVSSEGVMTATDAILSGKITSNDALFGGWKVSESGFVNDDGTSYIICRNGDSTKIASIGTSTLSAILGGTQAMGYFVNTETNPMATNYGIYAKASNSGYAGYAYAGYFKGDMKVIYGGIIGHKKITDFRECNNNNNGLIDITDSAGVIGYCFHNINFTDDRWNYLPSVSSYEYGECIVLINDCAQGSYNLDLKSRTTEYINGTLKGKIELNNPGDSVTLCATRISVYYDGAYHTVDSWRVINFACAGTLGNY